MRKSSKRDAKREGGAAHGGGGLYKLLQSPTLPPKSQMCDVTFHLRNSPDIFCRPQPKRPNFSQLFHIVIDGILVNEILQNSDNSFE